MAKWLMKSEPDVYSWEDLVRDHVCHLHGRNQALRCDALAGCQQPRNAAFVGERKVHVQEPMERQPPLPDGATGWPDRLIRVA